MAPTEHIIRSRYASQGADRVSSSRASGPEEHRDQAALVALARLLGRQAAREQLSAADGIELPRHLDRETSPTKARARSR